MKPLLGLQSHAQKGGGGCVCGRAAGGVTVLTRGSNWLLVSGSALWAGGEPTERAGLGARGAHLPEMQHITAKPT